MPCVKSGARAGSLYRNLVAHALTLGASGDRAPVRQQPCNMFKTNTGLPEGPVLNSKSTKVAGWYHVNTP